MPPSEDYAIIKLDGSEISADLLANVIAMEWRDAYNAIPIGRIEFADWDAQLFDWMGKTLEVMFTQREGAGTYKGEVVRVAHETDRFGNYACVVEFKPKAWRLALCMNAKVFNEQKVSDIVSSVVGACGATATCEATTITHKEILQCNESDLDFLHRLLEDEAQCFRIKPDTGAFVTENPLTFSGETIDCSELTQSASAEHYPSYGKVDVKSWDYVKKQAVTDQGDVPSGYSAFGSLTSLERSPAIAVSKDVAADFPPVWKKGAVARAEGDRSRVQGVVIDAEIQPGSKVKIPARPGAQDWGSAHAGVVESVIRLDQKDGLRTSFVGVDVASAKNTASTYLPQRAAPRPVLAGVHSAIVVNVDDPDAQGRIQLKFPYWADDFALWARVVQPMAGPQRGTLFYPKVDDEVLVAFTAGDPNMPVVIGSLYNGVDKPVEPACGAHQVGGETVGTSIWDGQNELSFNDKSGQRAIWLQNTDKTNMLVMKTDDKLINMENTDGKITIKAGNQASIEMDANTGDITIKCANMKIAATAKFEVKANADAKIEGLNVEAKGSVGFKGEGGATAELKGGGQTTVKGAMVMIN